MRDELDQSSNLVDWTNAVFGISAWISIGNSFTLSQDQYLTRIRVYVHKAANCTDNLYMIIHRVDANDYPVESVVTSGTVLNANIPTTYVTTDFTFTPTFLQAGKYAFTVHRTGSLGTLAGQDYYTLRAQNSSTPDAYFGGIPIGFTNNYWTDFQVDNKDFWFEQYKAILPAVQGISQIQGTQSITF